MFKLGCSVAIQAAVSRSPYKTARNELFTSHWLSQIIRPDKSLHPRGETMNEKYFAKNITICCLAVDPLPHPLVPSNPHQDAMIRIKKKSIRNFFFLLAILLILFISASRPHNQPPRMELGGAVHIDCSSKCDYWDGHRWHCCGNGGGGSTNQPPTITATLLCARNSTNGWCRHGDTTSAFRLRSSGVYRLNPW